MLNVSGFKSLKIAKDLDLRSVKLHTTHFFNDLINEIKNEFQNLYFSIGGIHLGEIKKTLSKNTILIKRNLEIESILLMVFNQTLLLLKRIIF